MVYVQGISMHIRDVDWFRSFLVFGQIYSTRRISTWENNKHLDVLIVQYRYVEDAKKVELTTCLLVDKLPIILNFRSECEFINSK